MIGLRPDPMADIVGMLRSIGLSVTPPGRDDYSVTARSDRFSVECKDERRGAPWDPKGLVLFFRATEPGATDWSFTVREAQILVGQNAVSVHDTMVPIEETERRLKALIHPLNQALQPFIGRGGDLRVALRKTRFPDPQP